MSDIKEGWQAEKHDAQRVYHYIHDTMSLCRKLGFYTGDLMPWTGNAKGREDCAECYRRAMARHDKMKTPPSSHTESRRR
ncbi:MAG: hypothetical protein ACHREM_19225 [Polyangiales bacterium]